MTEAASIVFDLPKYKALRKRYDEAVRDKETVFTFEGHQFVTGYAKHLLDYLSGVFDEKAHD